MTETTEHICTRADPYDPGKHKGLHIVHPDVDVVAIDGSSGWDEHLKCPWCGVDWWEECDD